MKPKLFSLILIFGGLIIFSPVLALETTWPASPLSPGFTLTDQSTLTDLVRYFYEWGVFLGGLAVAVALLIGGFLYLTSAGDPGRLKEAKDRIFSAIIGLVLLFAVYLILKTINPELTMLNLPPVGVGSPCNSDSDCPKGVVCEGGTCVFKIEFTNCDTNNDCPSGSECNDPNPGNGKKEGVCISTSSSSIRCDKDEDCPQGYFCNGGDPDTKDVLEGFCTRM
jgi:hypothetical protein